jgi:L-alanine-DL-glutamate epimerase-like enolase superfamily enzyme
MRKPESHEPIEAAFYHLEVPLLKPFTTATGNVAMRSVGLVSVAGSDAIGWGEASPYPGQDEPFGGVLEAARTGAVTPTLAAALDEAMCDLVARERGVSLNSELGPTDVSVPISLAVGIGSAPTSTVRTAWDAGVTRFKIKIMPGQTGHVADVRRLFPDAIIGVDANASFDMSTIDEILALASVDIAYVEQPTAGVDDAAVRMLADAGFTVFVDESIRSVSDAQRVLAIPTVSGVVVKPGRLGWSASVEVVRMARAVGKLWRASGLLETGVGRAFSLSLAAASDSFVSDVAPASWFFSYDVASQPIDGGKLVVPTGAGTGLDVDTDVVTARALEVIPLSGSAIPGFG